MTDTKELVKYEKDGKIYYDYDKVKILVFTKPDELKMYYKLFKLLCENDIITSYETPGMCKIETDKSIINFYPKSFNQAIGSKAHYVLNLTRDQEFDDIISPTITYIRDFLDKEKFGL